MIAETVKKSIPQAKTPRESTMFASEVLTSFFPPRKSFE